MTFFKALWQTVDGHLTAPATKTIKGLPASSSNGEAVRHEQLVVAANRVLGSVAGGPASGVQVTPAMLSPVTLDRIISGAVTNGTKATLGTLQSGTSSGTWASVVSDEQEVPAAGKYRITVRARASSSSTSSGAFVGARIDINGSSTGAYSDVTRYSTDDTAILTIPQFSHDVNITDPATQKISVMVLGSGTITLAGSTACRLYIERLW